MDLKIERKKLKLLCYYQFKYRNKKCVGMCIRVDNNGELIKFLNNKEFWWYDKNMNKCFYYSDNWTDTITDVDEITDDEVLAWMI